MTRSVFSSLSVAAVVACMGLGGLSPRAYGQQEVSLESPWYFSPSIGVIDFEGDNDFKDGFVLVGRLGYDYSETWGFELAANVAPQLDANTRNTQFDENGKPLGLDANGNPIVISVPRTDVGDTYAAGLSLDGLFHFTRWERLDPFLSAGMGFFWYGDSSDGENFSPSVRVGGGVMYHFNDEWALRADARTFVSGNSTEAQGIFDAGIVWNWGAHVAPSFVASGGPKDSDGDGLSDEDEAKWGTDPFDPDTDKDGLTDGEEVFKYKTDPLNPDTDLDALKDGPEVHQYATDPTKRDTDNGGVADGHEVIEDSTNPLDPTDDLQLFELYLQFDYDKAIIKPEYYPKLDVIAKVLQRDPGSTARIEGHADRLKKSSASYNKKLSKQRASAVLQYLVDHGSISASRMEAFGYGFDRPKAPNDPLNGNPENRRVEVYIRGASRPDVATGQPFVVPVEDAPTAP
ncbi:MAG: OmpA family protein [Lentisphaerae bacterium]|nr:OmpA family protein [Lentisphaerota bacterium]